MKQNVVSNTTFVNLKDYSSDFVYDRRYATDTLVDFNGNELAMGTDFDHFGIKAAHQYKNLPRKILNHRKKFRKIMEANGFTSLPSKWCHYNLVGSKKDKVSIFKWHCD